MAIRTPGTTHADGQEQAAVVRLFEQRAPASHLPDEPAAEAAPMTSVATVSSELTEQLDELDRCLERMDAVMAMLEADLDRRDTTMRALFAGLPELGPLSPAPPNPAAQPPSAARPRRRRSRRTRRRRQA